MDVEDGTRAAGPAEDLSLRHAAELYDVPRRTLAYRVRQGQIDGYRTRGTRGQEWRVSRGALEAFGYRQRPAGGAAPEDRVPAALQRDLAAAHRAVVAERRRADELDQRLGHLMLECGRLRAALAAAKTSRVM